MTWWEAVIYLWLVTAVLVAVYYTGRNMQRRDDRSREEAIRKEAYRAGSEWSADFWRTRCSQTDWDKLYQGQFDTKESS